MFITLKEMFLVLGQCPARYITILLEVIIPLPGKRCDATKRNQLVVFLEEIRDDDLHLMCVKPQTR